MSDKTTGVWYSVAERLPELGQWVICCRPGHHLRMFRHTTSGWRREDGGKPSFADEYLFWMALPEPPQ